VTRICTILVILGCVQTYANSSRFSELEKDAVNNSEVLEAYKEGNYSDAEKVHNKTSEYQEHKDLTREIPMLKGTKIYRKTIQELIDKYPEFKKAFESAQKDYNGKY